MRYLNTSVLVAALTPGAQTQTAHIQHWLANQDPNDLRTSDWGSE